MYRNPSNGSATLTVGAGTAAVLAGEDDLTQWTDEELLRGRRRDKNGMFTGKPNKVIPIQCVRELTRRRLFETESIIREACVEAAKYLDVVVRGDAEPKMGRIRAAETILDRFLGKPIDRSQMKVEMDVKVSPFEGLVKESLVFASVQTGEVLDDGGRPTKGQVLDANAKPVEPINVEATRPNDTPPWRRPPPEPDEDDYTFDDDEDIEWE